MNFDLENLEIDPDAARQYIDARTVFLELERSRKNALQVRGGMVWKTVDDKDYLIRTSTTGGQKSLGRRSAETEAIYGSFIAKKQSVEERLSGLKAAVAKHERLNRALRVGRMPTIAVAILARLANAGLDAGFAQKLLQDAPSMLAALQKVDKTFQVNEDQKYTAINKDGFEVDIIRRMAKEGDPHPIRLSDAEEDFWGVQAERADELVNAPEFSEIVVAENGTMARLTTIHPAVFVSFKRWMSKEPDRDPLKRRRDSLQADAVEWALHERLPQLLTNK